VLDPAGYDAELRRHNDRLRAAAGVRLDDDVLDVGCGAGQTTREAAQAARAGSAHGVDLAATAIERAREAARADGLRNVTFEQADAQVHPFPPERFDLAISRFGTMFFADPVAAFANIGRALRPAGRLVMMVWQARELNEWAVAINGSVQTDGGSAFSLADPPAATEILHAAGYTGVTFADVREPVYYGPDLTAALDWIHGFRNVSEALQRLEPAAAARAEERLRRVVAEHLTEDGVRFDSRAWIVSAHRAD